MVINTNISAQTRSRCLAQSSTNLSKALEELSSGSKINSPADDSAGLAVSMNLTAQMGRQHGGQSDNVNNAISFNQTQDGYLQQVNNALDRMSELAVQAQDVTKSDSDRAPVSTGVQHVGQLHQQRVHAELQRRQPVRRHKPVGRSPLTAAASTFANLGVNLRHVRV